MCMEPTITSVVLSKTPFCLGKEGSHEDKDVRPEFGVLESSVSESKSPKAQSHGGPPEQPDSKGGQSPVLSEKRLQIWSSRSSPQIPPERLESRPVLCSYLISLLFFLVYHHKYLWFSIWLCHSQPMKTKGACSHPPSPLPPHQTSIQKESEDGRLTCHTRRMKG